MSACCTYPFKRQCNALSWLRSKLCSTWNEPKDTVFARTLTLDLKHGDAAVACFQPHGVEFERRRGSERRGARAHGFDDGRCQAGFLGEASVGVEFELRLEMAAEVPTPAEHLSERRMLQLQLLTRRHAAAPSETWVDDVAGVLASAFDASAARRLQTVLKVLLKR